MTLDLNNRQREVLKHIAKWKVMGMPHLREEMQFNKNKSTFTRLIQKIENRGAIRARYLGGYFEKIVHLTQAGLMELDGANSELIDASCLRHDWITGLVARNLLKSGQAQLIKFPHEFGPNAQTEFLKDIRPDVILGVLAKGAELTCALEVELSRKDATRLREKFNKYLKNQSYQKVIYAMEHRSDFEGYKDIFRDWKSQINPALAASANKKFIFFYSAEMENLEANLKKAEAFHDGKTSAFENIFA